MCKEYDENKQRLAELVFALKSFTEDELTQKFSNEKRGRIEIGHRQSIHDFLDDLRELGVLGFEEGRYQVHEAALRQNRVFA